MASLTRQNWRETADYAIEWTLRDPDRGTYRSDNDTFCYQRLIYLVDNRTKRTVGTATVRVVVARRSHNIITAIPGGKC